MFPIFQRDQVITSRETCWVNWSQNDQNPIYRKLIRIPIPSFFFFLKEMHLTVEKSSNLPELVTELPKIKVLMAVKSHGKAASSNLDFNV